ncbi:MAG: hypothetical protein H7Z42_13615 [Roseiflexaceae bacterium]|nr:hypothetical protein [Roseiflexaceae bacterium]
MSPDRKFWLRPAPANLIWLVLFVIGLINLVRGGGHLLLSDGGAGAAGISLAHSGAADLVYVFGVSGAFELLLALWQGYIALWQRALLAAGFWTQIAKSGLVLLLGYALKPPVGPPPGLIPDAGTLIAAALCLVLLALFDGQAGRPQIYRPH